MNNQSKIEGVIRRLIAVGQLLHAGTDRPALVELKQDDFINRLGTAQWEVICSSLTMIGREEAAARGARELLQVQRSRAAAMTLAERAARLAAIQQLGQVAQLDYIARDSELSPNFYPGKIAAAATDQVLAALSSETRSLLRQRLKGRFRGAWGKLKNRLSPD